MGNESISQAEIDALIRGDLGGSFAGTPASPSPAVVERLTALLQTASGGSLALFGDAMGVGSLSGAMLTAGAALDSLPGPALAVSLDFAGTLPGRGYLILPEALAATMVGRASGGMPPREWGDDAQGALAEIASQLLGSGVTSLASQLGRTINLGLLTCALLPNHLPDGLNPGEEMVGARFSLHLAETEGSALLLITTDLAQALEGTPPKAAPAPSHSAPTPQAAVAPTHSAPPTYSGPPRVQSPAPQAFGHAAAATQPLHVQRVDFPDFSGPGAPPQEARNIDLILDVSLQVTVELGRTRKQIRDVLALAPGSVVELDKLAGETVDVLVNGKLIAKGEVVVVDDNFGVRITDIISPAERAASLR